MTDEWYRPRAIAEFIGLERQKRILANFARNPRSAAFLFTGPSGTGKTTMALALCDAIAGELIHIPSQHCTVAELEESLRMTQYVPMAGKRFWFVLVDEADQMTDNVYARVSTVNHGQDASLQTREMHQFGEARGWKLADEYVDQGVSGSKDSRPELNRLMADAKRRKFDVVLVWKLDRFGRSLRHLVNALAEFESLNITFVSLSDNLDLSTASGRLMFNIIGAMAEFERALIQERVKAGIRNARAKGKRIGRPRKLVDVLELDRLRKLGFGWKKIANELNLGVGTVMRIVKSRKPVESA